MASGSYRRASDFLKLLARIGQWHFSGEEKWKKRKKIVSSNSHDTEAYQKLI